MTACRIFPKILHQYANFHDTHNQLNNAVKKIDTNAHQLSSKLFPTIIRQENLTSPLSVLTGKSSWQNTVTITASSTADMPRSKGGRPQRSTIQARTKMTEQLKCIIAEASQQVLHAQKRRRR